MVTGLWHLFQAMVLDWSSTKASTCFCFLTHNSQEGVCSVTTCPCHLTLKHIPTFLKTPQQWLILRWHPCQTEWLVGILVGFIHYLTCMRGLNNEIFSSSRPCTRQIIIALPSHGYRWMVNDIGALSLRSWDKWIREFSAIWDISIIGMIWFQR